MQVAVVHLPICAVTDAYMLQIFSNLLPGDLVSLSRSTKSFRQLLMRRSSITIWQAARRNVPDLPDCPPELSEPAYANLLFTTNCHVSAICSSFS